MKKMHVLCMALLCTFVCFARGGEEEGGEGLNITITGDFTVNSGDTKTYTYDPLIGVTSTTDARGSTQYFQYNGFNRLSIVKDQYGNILSKNNYSYKN